MDDDTVDVNAPDALGVYELGNRLRNVIYIGSGNLLERLKFHLTQKRGGIHCFTSAYYFRFERTYSDERARQRERALLRAYEEEHERLPECNYRIG